jgi:hypothetical protein
MRKLFTELAISPIESMVSGKCLSAEREFLAIACGQTLGLKKMAATKRTGAVTAFMSSKERKHSICAK